MATIKDVLRVAKDWNTGDNSAMGLFADMGIIIDNRHRDNLVDEIQERLDQCIVHRSDLECILEDEPILENFLRLAENTELVVDYGP